MTPLSIEITTRGEIRLGKDGDRNPERQKNAGARENNREEEVPRDHRTSQNGFSAAASVTGCRPSLCRRRIRRCP